LCASVAMDVLSAMRRLVPARRLVRNLRRVSG
jgi:hypothetical protein